MRVTSRPQHLWPVSRRNHGTPLAGLPPVESGATHPRVDLDLEARRTHARHGFRRDGAARRDSRYRASARPPPLRHTSRGEAAQRPGRGARHPGRATASLPLPRRHPRRSAPPSRVQPPYRPRPDRTRPPSPSESHLPRPRPSGRGGNCAAQRRPEPRSRPVCGGPGSPCDPLTWPRKMGERSRPAKTEPAPAWHPRNPPDPFDEQRPSPPAPRRILCLRPLWRSPKPQAPWTARSRWYDCSGRTALGTPSKPR